MTISLFSIVIMREHFLLSIGNVLVVTQTLQPADVIHVIAGKEHRLDYAILLYRQGYGKQIVLTGAGWCLVHNAVHGQLWIKRALEQGVMSEAIVTDDVTITSTYSEVLRLKAFMEHSPASIRSVIVVSDMFHMRRAQWVYRMIFGDKLTIQMAPVPFSWTPYHQRWWMDAQSRLYVKSEYEKLIYYFFRYWIDWHPLSQWLSSFDED